MDLRTRVIGTGDHVIVFLHGLFGQGRNWTRIANGMADLATCVLLDAPNHGHSPWTDTMEYPRVATIIADHLARTGHTGPHVTLLGHSMGGKLAMRIALDRPGSLGRLVVADIAPRRSTLDSFESLIGAMRRLDLRTVASRRDAEQALARDVPDPGVANFLLQNLRHDLDETTGVRRWRWAMNLDLLGERLHEVGAWTAPAGARFTGPVLWLAGARSGYIRPEDSEQMRALFPAVRKVTVKDAGHWLHSDQPEVVIDLLRAFVTGRLD